MFVYLSKKIAVPDGGELQTVAWSRDQGWIACGGDDGMLKVLKLDHSMQGDPASRGVAAPSNLTMNQTLEGHKCRMMCVAWNGKNHKLTTSDNSGLIIVWVLYKGRWFEEMVNNRETSVVTDMEWTADGKKICIVYEDGAIIVGSVEGNRIWGDELKNLTLHKVAWSPDAKVILFGTGAGEVQAYDSNGLFMMKLTILCLANFQGVIKLAGLKWYNGYHGYFAPGCPSLVVAYTNGRMQLMRNEADSVPILVDTMMTVVGVNWNDDGSILAVAGQQRIGERDCNILQFYNPMGEHLRTLKVPGHRIRGVDWDGYGLRLVMAVDTHLYFANIRGNHRWGYCTNTIIYSLSTRDRPEHSVVFWDYKNNERYVKHVRLLTHICAHKEFCLLTARNSDVMDQQVLVLCNTIGSPLEHKYIEMDPLFFAITDYQVFAASREAVYIWEFKQRSRLATHDNVPGTASYRSANQKGFERVLHVDDTPSGVGQGALDFRKAKKPARDPIASITASTDKLVLGRESGLVQVYSLPKVSLVARHDVQCRPATMALNADNTRLAVVDINGIMGIFDFEQRDQDGEFGVRLKFERKDIWDIKWAEDNPTMFAVMEKTRMYIFRDLDPEEPITSSGYICEFRNLEVTTCMLDEIMKDPDHPEKESVLELEIKSLRDSRDLLSKVNVTEATQFIKDNPHPRLWQLLADSALETLDLDLAEQAFVHCLDYHGIQFVKRLRRLQDERKQRAEVQSYFKNFEGAERAYMAEDRRDLAVHLRTKLGDWFRVLQLMKAGSGGGDDIAYQQALNACGDYYTDRQKWKQAVTYYQQANNNSRLVHCYLQLEDYEALRRVAGNVPDGDVLCQTLGERFSAVGMCQDAVNSFLKVNNIKDAVDTCVNLNRWHQAVILAKKHNLPNIDTLLARYASHLLEQKNVVDAVQLYREANRFTDGAALLYKLAEETLQKRKYQLAKKIYIMAGIMIEDYRKSRMAASAAASKPGEGNSASLYLDEEGQDPEIVKMLDTTWRGAEAIHYFLAAQRYIYEGEIMTALTMALRASQYDDILNEDDIYILLALASAMGQALDYTSQAFTALDEMDSMSESFKKQLEELAVSIFVGKGSKDQRHKDKPAYPQAPCDMCSQPMDTWMPVCPTCGHRVPFSITDGRRIDHNVTYVECSLCHHNYEAMRVGVRRDQLSCPLCFKFAD